MFAWSIVLAVILMLAWPAGCAEGSVSVYFDQDGNVLSGPPKPLPAGRTARYATPEGITLRQDVFYEQYPVFGSNFSEIMQSIRENGPYNRRKDKRLPTDITWTFGISYQFSFVPEVDEDTGTVHLFITVSDIAFDYVITVVLPALIDDSSLNPVEKSLWKQQFLSLLEHEYNHIRIIKDPYLEASLSDSITELNYLSLEFTPDLDFESIVRSALREEIEGLGQEWAKKIRGRIDASDHSKVN